MLATIDGAEKPYAGCFSTATYRKNAAIQREDTSGASTIRLKPTKRIRSRNSEKIRLSRWPTIYFASH